MMKVTAWFCPVLLTLLSATRLVCTAPRGAATSAGGGGGEGGGAAGSANGYPLDYLNAQAIQDEYSLAKRNKPSLSIVNPLDVLRQRLLLEIARRQMKENTRQVELNRAILKTVGKRVFLEPTTWCNARYQQQQQQAVREQLRREQLQQQHFPSQLWSYGNSIGTGAGTGTGNGSPAASSSLRFFDFLQRPTTHAKQQQLDDANRSLGLAGGVARHQQANGNEIAHETNHGNGNRKTQANGKSATGDAAAELDEDDAVEDPDDVPDELNFNWAGEQPNELDSNLVAENANGRLPWRLVYRMHNNPHYAN